jgi:N-methylhydantoinase A
MGARHAAEQLGLENILIGDMGGTSFDTAVLPNLQPTIAKQATFGPFHTGINILDIVSVGAGGGSIAVARLARRPPGRPAQRGSEPGPACYGAAARGRRSPTPTSCSASSTPTTTSRAATARRRRRQKACRRRSATARVVRRARRRRDLRPRVIEMANALRVVSIERGHDPREFTFFSYGGGLGLFRGRDLPPAGLPRIIIPDNSLGLLGLRRADRGLRAPVRPHGGLGPRDASRAEVNAIAAEMIAQAMPTPPARASPRRTCGSSAAATSASSARPTRSPCRSPTAAHPRTGRGSREEFPRIYERNYGEGTRGRARRS